MGLNPSEEVKILLKETEFVTNNHFWPFDVCGSKISITISTFRKKLLNSFGRQNNFTGQNPLLVQFWPFCGWVPSIKKTKAKKDKQIITEHFLLSTCLG